MSTNQERVRHYLWNTVLWLVLAASSPLVSAESAGQLAQKYCAACHQADGNSTLDDYPKIAAQHAGYLEIVLKAYRQGGSSGRANAIMQASVATLTDQDISALAKYFSEQTLSANYASEQSIALGQSIFRAGIVEKGVPACMACHGPAGEGIASAKYPRVAMQHARYLVTALKAYRSHERKNIIGNGIMNSIAKQLSDDEMLAVANYMSGLQKRK